MVSCSLACARDGGLFENKEPNFLSVETERDTSRRVGKNCQVYQTFLFFMVFITWSFALSLSCFDALSLQYFAFSDLQTLCICFLKQMHNLLSFMRRKVYYFVSQLHLFLSLMFLITLFFLLRKEFRGKIFSCSLLFILFV